VSWPRVEALDQAGPRSAVIALAPGRVVPIRVRQFLFPRTIGRTCRKLTVGARSDSAPPAAARRSRRPLLVLCVPCDCAKHKHTYPWRGDWPVDASVRSHQEPRCRKHKSPDGVWLALDPERLEISQQASQEGQKDFLEWKAWWDTLSAGERTAISKGRVAAEPRENGSEHRS